MAVRLKSNVQYQPMVEQINRKFVPRKDVCSNEQSAGPVIIEAKGWMGGATLQVHRGGLGATARNFLVVRANARATAPSEDEQAARVRFSKAVKGRNKIAKDLQQITRVQDAFKNSSADTSITYNGVSAYGYTFKGFIFAVQYAGLMENPEYDFNTFPLTPDA